MIVHGAKEHGRREASVMEMVRLVVIDGEPNQFFVQTPQGRELLSAIPLPQELAKRLLEWLSTNPGGIFVPIGYILPNRTS